MAKVIQMIDGQFMSDEEKELMMKDGTIVAMTPSGDFQFVINSVGAPMIRTRTGFCLLGTPIHYLFLKDVKADDIKWCDSETGMEILSEEDQFKQMILTQIRDLKYEIARLKRANDLNSGDDEE